MKRFYLISVMLILGSALILSSCAAQPTPSAPAPTPAPAPAPAPAPIELKMVSFTPVTHSQSMPVKIAKEKIEAATKGRVIMKYLGGPEVIGAFDQVDAVKSGTLDAQLHLPAMYTAKLMPEGNLRGLSQFFPWEERQSGGFALWSEIVAKKLNAKYLGRFETALPGFYVYTLQKPIKKIDDFSGLTLRVAPLYTAAMKKLNVAPVNMPGDQIYTALERKVLDGAIWPGFGVNSWGWQEFLKYKIEPGIFQTDSLAMINLNTWNKLPKDLQDAIEKVAPEIERAGLEDVQGRIKAEWVETAKAGMQLIQMDPEEAKKFLQICSDTTWEEGIKQAPEYGPQLKKVLTK